MEHPDLPATVANLWKAAFDVDWSNSGSPLEDIPPEKLQIWAGQPLLGAIRPPPNPRSEGPFTGISTSEQISSWASRMAGQLNPDTVNLIKEQQVPPEVWVTFTPEDWKTIIPNVGQRKYAQLLMRQAGILPPVTPSPTGTPDFRAQAQAARDQLVLQLKNALDLGDFKTVTAVSAKLEKISTAMAAPSGVDDIVAWARLEEMLKTAAVEDVVDITHEEEVKNRLTQTNQALVGLRDPRVLRGPLNPASHPGTPAAPSRAPMTSTNSLFAFIQGDSRKSGIDRLGDMLEVGDDNEKVETAAALLREVRTFESLHPIVTKRVPTGFVPAKQWVDTAMQHVSGALSNAQVDQPSVDAISILHKVKSYIEHSQDRANNEPSHLGPDILGLLAFAGVTSAREGLTHFRTHFQVDDFPDVVSPKVWLQLVQKAAHIQKRRDLRTQILDARENAKRDRDRRYMRALQGNPASVAPPVRSRFQTSTQSTTGASRAAIATRPAPSRGPPTDWRPLADSWKPRKHTLDGPLPPIHLLNAIRGYYDAMETKATNACEACGLDHVPAQVCHWQKLPFHRSKHFKGAFKAMVSKGFYQGSEIDEWNSRAGREEAHKSNAEGKSPSGWVHLRTGWRGGPKKPQSQ